MSKPKKKSQPLHEYFEHVWVLKKIEAGHISPKVISEYRTAITFLRAYMKRDVTVEEVDSEMLNRFKLWLLEQKRTKQRSANNKVWAVKAIVRLARPDAFPTEGSGSGQSLVGWIDADVKGTLEQIFKDDYLPERTAISSPNTVKQYARCLHLFSVFLGRPGEPSDLTDRCVGTFLRHLVEVTGVRARTANGYVKQLKAMWNWLAKKRVVDRFPTVDKLKEPEPTPMAWSREDLNKFMAACDEQVGMIAGVLANHWWVAFHRVLWDSGERTGAMFALKWDWLDLKSGHLSVPGEFRKGRQKSMVYKLKSSTLDALRRIRKPDRELIFANDHLSMFYHRYRQILKDAGLPYVPHKSGPQKWRRSFASHIEAAGGNATRALKHRDRRVTEDSYLDPKITEIESENKNLFPLDGEAA
jgi:integrase